MVPLVDLVGSVQTGREGLPVVGVRPRPSTPWEPGRSLPTDFLRFYLGAVKGDLVQTVVGRDILWKGKGPRGRDGDHLRSREKVLLGWND